MWRLAEKVLVEWSTKPRRKPLILQGARQVGKTHLMKWLGERHFARIAYFNFDERPELNEFFEKNKSVDRIVNALALISGTPIDANTLIVLDELQECPEAINALKYFRENRPELPIICAGSLLGVGLQYQQSFPVGKVEFMNVHPMSFREVLPHWDERSAGFLESLQSLEPLPELFFNDLVQSFRKYLVTGGLPEVIKLLNETGTFTESDTLLDALILSYKNDFAKHPVMSDVAKIGQVFDSLPAQLARENKKFVYQLVRTGARAREYEDAIQWLIRAGMVHQVKLTTKPALPLAAYDDLSAFKLYCFDVGILRRMTRLSPAVFAEGNRLLSEFKGAITENYILQSLVTQFEEAPRYWSSGNTAEVDFILQYRDTIIPIEVKSDENVKSRSLTMYQQKFAPPLRIRYSLKNLSYRDGLLNIPHFMADYTRSLIDSIFDGQLLQRP